MWQFDARQYEPSAGIETWPKGKHPVIITASEEKPVKGDKPGMFWEFTIKAIDGPMKDKVQFIRLNHKNSGEKAQQTMDIAHRTMSAICYACGVIQFNHPNMLHNIPFVVEAEVKSQPVVRDGVAVMGADGKPEMREQNEFRNFYNMQLVSAVDLAKGMTAGAGQQQPANAAGWGAPAGQPAQPPAQPMQAQPAQQWQPPVTQPGPAAAQPAQAWQPPANAQPPAGQPVQQQPPAGWNAGQPTQPAQPPQQQPQQQWQPPANGQQPPPAGAAPWGAPQG